MTTSTYVDTWSFFAELGFAPFLDDHPRFVLTDIKEVHQSTWVLAELSNELGGALTSKISGHWDAIKKANRPAQETSFCKHSNCIFINDPLYCRPYKHTYKHTYKPGIPCR